MNINPFGKKPQDNKYPEIVNVIHGEFNSASDKILASANEVLSNIPAALMEKGKRLSALGFHKTQEATEANQFESKRILSQELAELVKYYQQHYPLNKFVDEQTVKEICEKYGLVCGYIGMFKGFVPEVKLTQIENFKLRKEEIPYGILVDGKENIIRFLSEEDIIEPHIKRYFESNDRFYVNNNGGIADKTTLYLKESLRPLVIGAEKGLCAVWKPERRAKMKICAPLKDMEIPESHRLEGYKIIHNPDPVVLQPVNGGYLIVAAWGDEASDEKVVNQINN